LFALGLLCGAQQEKTSFEKLAFPFEAEVTATNLNVRMSPKSDPTSVIATTLALGAKVTVVAEKEDFFQILPPAGCTVWVHSKNVKRDGEEGIVLVNDSPVRIDSRQTADKLCSLNEGEKVKIVAEHMGWFKIQAPAAVKYFVGKKHVKFLKEAEGIPAAKVDEDSIAQTKLREAEALIIEMNRKIESGELDLVDFNQVVALYDEAAVGARSDAVKKEAEAGAKSYRNLQTVWNTYKAQKKGIDEQIRLLREEQRKRNEPTEKAWVFAGYVDMVGLVINRPGTHKLVMAGKTICYLKAKEGDQAMLKKFGNHYRKYVGVTGTVVKDPEGWEGYSVVIVDEVAPITPKK